MIAIFGQQRDISNIRCMPSNNFKIIRDVNSVRGIKFTGIITLDGFYLITNIKDAYDELYKRQPELFTLKTR